MVRKDDTKSKDAARMSNLRNNSFFLRHKLELAESCTPTPYREKEEQHWEQLQDVMEEKNPEVDCLLWLSNVIPSTSHSITQQSSTSS